LDVYMLNYDVVVLPATTSSTTCHPPSCRWHYSRAQKICACIAVYVSKIFHSSSSYAIHKYSHIITTAKIYYFVFYWVSAGVFLMQQMASCMQCTPLPLHARQ
jgi:hypothetical protein